MNSAPASNEASSGNLLIPNRREELSQAERTVLKALHGRRYDDASCFAVRLALEEALTNAYIHGNKSDPAKTVRLQYRVQSDIIEIEVQDQGEGFDPDTVPDPTAVENLEIPSGRGLTLIRAFMTEVIIHPPGNRMKMKYVRPR